MLQKLLKYFDCTIVLAFFVQLFSFSLVLSCLNFNETLSSINLTKMPASFKAGFLCSIAINFQIILNNCHSILSNYTSALLHQCLWHYLFVYFTYAMSKRSTVLNTLSLFFAAALTAVVFTTDVTCFISMYTSL